MVKHITAASKARLDGLYLFGLGALVFLLFGLTFARLSAASMIDFKILYYYARAFLDHGDPYSITDPHHNHVLTADSLFGHAAGDQPEICRYIYPPPTFAITLPFALFSFPVAATLWTILVGGSLCLASYLLWNYSTKWSPVLAGAIIGFLLGNSELPLMIGNAAAVAIACAVLASLCFLTGRRTNLGVLLLVIGLILKPHDTALVWLFFLLAGRPYRRFAWQTLGVLAILSLPFLLWTTAIAPRWPHEFLANMAFLGAQGGLNDPSPTSRGGHGMGMMINLQTAISAIWSEPHLYNAITYLVCGILFLLWCLRTIRTSLSVERAWIGLAVIASLTLLPVYHRQSDAPLLLLSIPACLILFRRDDSAGRWALILTASGVFFTGGLPWVVLLGAIRHLRLPASPIYERAIVDIQVFPIPVVLLSTAIFYLWVYYRWQAPSPEVSRTAHSPFAVATATSESAQP
jgi:hypothetical protein